MGWEKEPPLEKVSKFQVKEQRKKTGKWTTTFSLQSRCWICHLPTELRSYTASRKKFQNCYFWSPFFSWTWVTSSLSRQIIRLRATNSKWHFDICASRIRQHTTNLAKCFGHNSQCFCRKWLICFRIYQTSRQPLKLIYMYHHKRALLVSRKLVKK